MIVLWSDTGTGLLALEHLTRILLAAADSPC
jgi:hypothetical protein